MPIGRGYAALVRALPRSRPLRLVLALLLLLAGAVAGTNGYVLGRGAGGTDDVAGVRHARAAIVLGALVQPDGRMSGMLQDRVDRALQLWRAGKVDRILVSGDHLRWGYDEPTTMRLALQRGGVPARAIFTDHAGVDTRATMVRAREVFAVDSAIVVTQGFHMGRALYLARAAGVDAQGVTSDLHPYGAQGRRSELREVLARTKSVASQLTGAHVLLGPEHPIDGDGRASWGPPGPPVAGSAPAAPVASSIADFAPSSAAAAPEGSVRFVRLSAAVPATPGTSAAAGPARVVRPSGATLVAAAAPTGPTPTATKDPEAPDPSIADGRAQRALDRARDRWAARGPRGYRMRLRLACFCPPEVTAARTVRVRHGRSTGTVPEVLRPFATVPRLFARVQAAIDAGAASLTVTYATGTGRPTSLAIDRSRMIADEETGLTVSGFATER